MKINNYFRRLQRTYERIRVSLVLWGSWAVLYAQNVGIGTSTPTERLHVQGNLRLEGAFMPGNNPGAAGALLRSAGTGVPPVWISPGANGDILTITGGLPTWNNGNGLFWRLIGNSGTNPAINFLGTTDAQPLVIRTNNTERMRVTEVGRVGIGTTTPHVGSRLDVQGSGTEGVLLPQVALTSANTWSPVGGAATARMLVYNTATAGGGINAVTPGYYYWDGTRWTPMRYIYPILSTQEPGTYTIPGSCSCHASCMQYTGIYIDLPPGQWVVMVNDPTGVKSLTAIPGDASVGGPFQLFTNSSCTGTAQGLLGGKIVGPENHGSLEGITIVSNPGTSVVRYY
ncbi:MAG: hypothetical protein N2170_03515, partial [Bacteroidia bacterium]|nr:hypothetical protein [Bacteroidia bacterium]